PTLICLEASADDAARNAWTGDVRFFAGYDAADPRPPFARTLDLARDAAKDHARVGVELSLGTQASDRMVGEPTTFTREWFDAFRRSRDGRLAVERWVGAWRAIVRTPRHHAPAALKHNAQDGLRHSFVPRDRTMLIVPRGRRAATQPSDAQNRNANAAHAKAR